MDDAFPTRGLLSVLALMIPLAGAAERLPPSPLSTAQWEELGDRVRLLDRVTYIPSLLPVIMKNREALDLSEAQIEVFRSWRKDHYERMVELMNEVIQRRIALSRAALDPTSQGAQILAEQQVLVGLQQDLLRLRLSCRDLVITTFTSEQWGRFAFILEDYPDLAGLMSP
jgi:hypothetical protein